MTRQLIRPGRIALAILSAVVLLVTATAGISPAAATKDKHKNLPGFDLAVSFSPDRSNAIKLNGATLARGQNVAIFVDPVDLWAHKAKFYVNHKFVNIDYQNPFDLAGTGASNQANLLSTDALKIGENKVRVDVYLAWFKLKSVEARFNVVPTLPLISEIVINDPNLSTLETALRAATASGPIDFLGVTSDPDEDLTLFAPTNAAFDALGDTLDDLLADPSGLLTQILAYHVLPTSETAAELIAAGSATTLQGEDITVTVDAGEVYINDVRVLIFDIVAKNGIVHWMDAVLMPPSPVEPELPLISEIVINDPQLEVLESALRMASISGPIDFIGATSNPNADLTVFAPTDDAFAALGSDTVAELMSDPSGLLTDILAYHVLGTSESAAELIAAGSATTLQGEDITITVVNGDVFINDAKVLIADIPAKNGIVHVIDAVLIPPSLVAPELPLISEIVINDPNLSTLETALTVATDSGPIDFLGATSDPDADLTVFAPTNDAFAALGSTLDDVLADPSGLLTQILAYHVLGTSESAAELIAAGSATTLQGEDITVTVVNGDVFINDAKVLIADIPAKNGIVHVIDAVLIPPSLVAPEPPAKGTIGGKTSDADGSPLTGVVVDLFAANGDGTRANWLDDTTTGPDGRFSFEVDPGCYVLVFIAPEGRTWAGSNSKWLNAPVCVASGETKGAVDATLNPAPVDPPPVDDKGTIGDKVVDGRGMGEAGVVIDLFATNADGSKAGWLGDTTTDADGMYSFEVAPGCYVVVFISPDNNAFETGRFFETHVCVAAGETRDDIDAFLKKF